MVYAAGPLQKKSRPWSKTKENNWYIETYKVHKTYTVKSSNFRGFKRISIVTDSTDSDNLAI